MIKYFWLIPSRTLTRNFAAGLIRSSPKIHKLPKRSWSAKPSQKRIYRLWSSPRSRTRKKIPERQLSSWPDSTQAKLKAHLSVTEWFKRWSKREAKKVSSFAKTTLFMLFLWWTQTASSLATIGPIFRGRTWTGNGTRPRSKQMCHKWLLSRVFCSSSARREKSGLS